MMTKKRCVPDHCYAAGVVQESTAQRYRLSSFQHWDWLCNKAQWQLFEERSARHVHKTAQWSREVLGVVECK